MFLNTDLASDIAASNTRDLGGLVAREAEEHLSGYQKADHDDAQAACPDCVGVRQLEQRWALEVAGWDPDVVDWGSSIESAESKAETARMHTA